MSKTDRLHVSAFIYKAIFRSGKGITEEDLQCYQLYIKHIVLRLREKNEISFVAYGSYSVL